MSNIENVKKQYSNSDNLNIRIAIHEKYSVNKQGFGNWINEQYEIPEDCRILELGCGNGDMWKEKIKHIGKNSTLILSDLSEGMVEEVKEKYNSYENVSFQQINI
ncbi:ubiquinone/menaquinone biosynthesis C-methylase UbiE [Anaerotaenia torta]|uniref:class I SAM-dependent methyltransferase n=1 Tax=Anaerotaenia torta TaxID=433293 RepID=UPI003D2441DC